MQFCCRNINDLDDFDYFMTVELHTIVLFFPNFFADQEISLTKLGLQDSTRPSQTRNLNSPKVGKKRLDFLETGMKCQHPQILQKTMLAAADAHRYLLLIDNSSLLLQNQLLLSAWFLNSINGGGNQIDFSAPVKIIVEFYFPRFPSQNSTFFPGYSLFLGLKNGGIVMPKIDTDLFFFLSSPFL